MAADGGGAGGSEGEGDAVEEEGGGEGAEQEVLDGGLGGGGLAFAEAGHDVGGDGGDLEADEDHEQLDGAGHEHHAGGAEEDEGEVLAGVAGVAFEVVERAEQGDEDDGGDEQVEEDGEGVDLDGAGEGVQACRRLGAGTSWRRRRATVPRMASQPSGLRLAGGLEAGLGQHDENAGEGEDVLGQQGENVGGHEADSLALASFSGGTGNGCDYRSVSGIG